MRKDSRRHLTYCTNVHPAETWPQVRAVLERDVAAVAERVAPVGAFPVGLRLSEVAVRELGESRARRDFCSLLSREDLEVFTINGFPYGEFSGVPVKAGVYRPSWVEPERASYTLRLAELLAEVLPSHHAYGSVSTVPGGFALEGPARDRVATSIADTAVELSKLEARSGRRIVLALEPEPMCMLSTSADVVAFFQEYLWAASTTQRVAQARGIEADIVQLAVRRHVGVCFDVCHAAVEFEVATVALSRIEAAGIFVAKVQLSCALALSPGPEQLSALAEFADDVYLHQVVARHLDGRLERHLDLPPALASRSARTAEAWRVHFHVPVFAETLAPLSTTRSDLEAVLTQACRASHCQHFEVETYSWPMLAPRYRGPSLADDIAHELAWVDERWQ